MIDYWWFDPECDIMCLLLPRATNICQTSSQSSWQVELTTETMAEQVILEEDYDENYEPTEEGVFILQLNA